MVYEVPEEITGNP